MSDAIRAETVFIGDEQIQAYQARPVDGGPVPGVVVIHHLPGYDEATKEMVRKFAANGYAAICPNLFWREAPGASPDDASAFVRGQGGIADEQIIRDVATAAAALRGLDNAAGKVGVIGHCSGGRQALLVATAVELDAAVDCYGAFALEPPPTGFPLRVTSIKDRLADVRCPVLGLFGDDDKYPAPAEVARLAELMAEHGKHFEYQSYEGAGHGFFAVDRPSYRPQAAVDGWQRIFAFFAEHLGS
ncbi:dienelactone hydrolase family protein [Dactylosporangium vinaceum]|uniref:Dienelactone hydrolase family protein n=1 Tax=Dactylosporangium vinaceum TaxID=53362 RepID=A0ABV5MH98_9ACTN|nr:dienelactone hydrolase family protein [Dactylosporangium vinaceum]UAB94825.1 dienelactone hydrolase family protein [Dactylosporangium vinaceum]